MTPSKKLMELVYNHLDEIYFVGVQMFFDYAFQKIEYEYEICCRCIKCYNRTLQTRKIVETHLIIYRTLKNFTF